MLHCNFVENIEKPPNVASFHRNQEVQLYENICWGVSFFLGDVYTAILRPDKVVCLRIPEYFVISPGFTNAPPAVHTSCYCLSYERLLRHLS